jgi:signal transduction histidine kinase
VKKASPSLAHLKRPVDATPVLPPRDALEEINLSRAWWILIVTTICTVLFTLSGKLTGTTAAFSTVQIVDYSVSFLFFVVLWMARNGRLTGKFRSALPLAYAIFFVLINDGYYFSAWPVAGDNVGYAFGVLTPAALLYLRPTRFVPFLLVNHLAVCVGILQQPAAFESTVSAIYGATISVVIATISSVINFRTKYAELEKTALVAKRNQELAAANLNLLQISERMDEMVAHTAHDLRGPLFGLASLCELEKENPAWQDKEHLEFLDMVGQSASHMGGRVNKMVEDYASRSDSLKGIPLGPCNLVEVLSGTVEQVRPHAQSKNIDLLPKELPDEALAEANSDALERVLGNLLSNAVKYSPVGARVELAVQKRNDAWVCEVRDEGPGVPIDEQATLFNKLQTGSNTPTSGEHSSGLGLHSARKLVESMNGSIAYEPRSTGGSIFRISLRAAA